MSWDPRIEECFLCGRKVEPDREGNVYLRGPRQFALGPHPLRVGDGEMAHPVCVSLECLIGRATFAELYGLRSVIDREIHRCEAPLPSNPEIHEQGNDGNGERRPAAGLGSDGSKDDDGAGEKDEREGGRHD